MDLTVVLTNYMRPSNIRVILDTLALQTLPHYLFVWDNSPEQTFQDQRVDWIIRSSRNAKCSARWWQAAHAVTPWVLILDDDLAFGDAQVLADVLSMLEKHSPSAIGAAGVILDPNKPYFKCRHVGVKCSRINADTPVDILKGRFFAVARQRLESLSFLPLDSEDDIAVSASLSGGVVVSSLQDRLRDLPTGAEALCRRPSHAQSRESARRRWFGPNSCSRQDS